MSSDEATFVKERIEKKKLLLDAIENAILALQDPTISAYTLDDGQTTQRVTRESLPELMLRAEALEAQIFVLMSRNSGSGTMIAQPAW